MNRDPRPVALVSGASSGIGWSTAKALAAADYRVVVTARREDRLAQLADEIGRSGGSALAVAANLIQEADRERLISAVRQSWGRIDVLVNNAGHGWIGWQAQMPPDTRRSMLAL